MRIVIALGALAPITARGDRPPEFDVEAAALTPLTATHDVLICHAMGLEVGTLAAENATDLSLTHPHLLDDLVAQTQGMVGYRLAKALRNAGVMKPVLPIITQTVVEPEDSAFSHPSRFVGPAYTPSRAARLAALYGWTVASDGDRWRRIVPAPEPRRVIERDAIDDLLGDGVVVIGGCGGGTAVTEDSTGRLTGVEAVLDTTRVAAMLAIALAADHLMVLTDVAGVMADFGTPYATVYPHLSVGAAADLRLPEDSMGLIADACCRFVTATGRPATIGALEDVAAHLTGMAGTTISATTNVGAREVTT